MGEEEGGGRNRIRVEDERRERGERRVRWDRGVGDNISGGNERGVWNGRKRGRGSSRV